MPQGVTATVEKSTITVKGPKGERVQSFDPDMIIKVEEGVINVERPTEQKRHKALHGLTRSLINNMVVGVAEGYKKELELVGVGYRANAKGQQLELALGYSHPIVFELPEEVSVSAVTERGSNPQIVLESTDKQLIGQVAAKIRSLRKPETI